MSRELVVSEIFGPTVQGEGFSLGRHCSFVRLGRCNLTCRWCDTPFTWDWKGQNGTVYDPEIELRKMAVGEVIVELEKHPTDLVVISGGEPLLQRTAVAELARQLTSRGIETEIETNGTLFPGETANSVTRYNISPKLSNSGVDEKLRIVPEVLSHFAYELTERCSYKFVVSSSSDFDEIDAIVDNFDLEPRRVYIMPEGTSRSAIDDHLLDVAHQAIERGYNLTTRLHVLLWGNKRGT